MKCINCETDNNLKDRTGNQGRCKNCNHPFVFEPTSMGNVKITDTLFAKVISDISANNTLFFTKTQLFYFLDNRLRTKSSSVSKWVWTYISFQFFGTIIFQSWFKFIFFIISFIFVFVLFKSSTSPKVNNKDRMASARALQVIGGIILAVGIFSSMFIFTSFIVFVISVILGMLSLYLGTRQLSRTGLAQELLFTQNDFQDWIVSWMRVNNSIVKMLPSPREENTLAVVNPDVSAYSFDRLVVCHSAAIAQLLIANNFHFENNCAILSITGYPQSIFATTMQMLRRNPDLQVYALHNCSPKGIGLVHHLRTSDDWFRDSNIVIIDVGIVPRQIIAAKRGMFIQSSEESAQAAKQLPLEIRQSLSNEELKWLEGGNFVELESFSPQRLIQVLHRGIAGGQNLASDDSSLILVGDPGSSDMYAYQSFG